MNKRIGLCLLFVLCFLLVGCGKTTEYLNNITYKELNKKISNKDSFVLEVVQTGCSNCTKFTPKFKSVLESNKVVAYSINLTELTESDATSFINDFKVEGTPTVIFFKDGKETSTMDRLSGANVSKDVIEAKLKKTGFIK